MQQCLKNYNIMIHILE